MKDYTKDPWWLYFKGGQVAYYQRKRFTVDPLWLLISGLIGLGVGILIGGRL